MHQQAPRTNASLGGFLLLPSSAELALYANSTAAKVWSGGSLEGSLEGSPG